MDPITILFWIVVIVVAVVAFALVSVIIAGTFAAIIDMFKKRRKSGKEEVFSG